MDKIISYRYEEKEQRLEIQYEQRTMWITVISDKICRIRVSSGERIAGSLAVEGEKRIASKVDCFGEEGRIYLKTESMEVVVAEDCHVDFYDIKGNLLTAGYRGEVEEAGTLSDKEKELLSQEGHEVKASEDAALECLLRMTLDKGDCIYGLGDKTGVLNKREYEYEMWNTDDPSPQEDNYKALYKSVPFMLVLKERGAYGLFFDSHEKSFFDLGKEDEKFFTYRVQAGNLEYYFMCGEELTDIVKSYTYLTGRAPMPMLWTLGYHQSRWSYKTETEIRELAENMKKHDLPCDCIHLDIDYMDGYRVFTWNKDNYRDQVSMIRELREEGIKIVTIIDPGVKEDKGYSVYDEGMEKGYFALDAGGNTYVNAVWPGDSVYPDFGREEVRRWWGQNHKFLLDQGVAGIWNDMNEPASFKGPLPDDVVFFDEEEKSTHKSMHNVYGHNMSKATYQGLEALDKRRPFVITRACYSGTQKYAVVWTGDNHSIWTHLRMAIPQLCNLGLSGYAFAGTDVGGFGSDVTGELLVRWYQTGCFSPLFRNHSAMGTRRQEPWLFGEENLNIIRKYIRLRYELLPYFYDLFYEHQQTGLPIMRPLVLHHGREKETHNMNDAFLLGENLLVSPVVEQGAVKKLVYLPEGTWYDYWTREEKEGGGYIIADAPLETCPIYVKSGTILPKYPVRNCVDAEKDEELILEVYPGQGSYVHYQDNGEDTAYREGEYNLYRFNRNEAGGIDMEMLKEGYKKYGKVSILPI